MKGYQSKYSAKQSRKPLPKLEYIKRRLDSRGQYGALTVLNQCCEQAKKGSKIGRMGVDMFLNAFTYHPISIHSTSAFGLSIDVKELIKHSAERDIYHEAIFYNFFSECDTNDMVKKTPITEVLANLQLLGKGVHTIDLIDETYLHPCQVVKVLRILRLQEGFRYRKQNVSVDDIRNVFNRYSSSPDLDGSKPMRTYRFSEEMMEWGQDNPFALKISELCSLNLSRLKLKEGSMEIFPPNPRYNPKRRETATLEDRRFVINDKEMIEVTRHDKREVDGFEILTKINELRDKMIENLLEELNPPVLNFRLDNSELLERDKESLVDALEMKKRRIEHNRAYRRRMFE